MEIGDYLKDRDIIAYPPGYKPYYVLIALEPVTIRALDNIGYISAKLTVSLESLKTNYRLMTQEEREQVMRAEIERLRGVVREMESEKEKLYGIFDAVIAEINKQDQKWGKQEHRMSIWLAIMTEEHGEVAKAVCDLYNSNNSDDKKKHLEEIELELVQTIAVGVQWLKYLKENDYRAKTMPV